MGKGDKRSKRGKITNGTFGKRRPQKTARATVKPTAATGSEKAGNATAGA